MDPSATTVYAIVLVAGLAGGFGLGLLRNRRNNRRLVELAGELESAHKQRESARAELGAARDALERSEREHEEYRNLVTAHFVGASDRLREFTLQYRAVYQHLAEGASALCRDGFPGLEGSFDALPERRAGADDDSFEAAEDRPA